ncbi:MAG: hypothetical protein ABI670_11070 [Chloroflexota bacterium]
MAMSTAKERSEQEWPWDDSLDTLIAAPEHHRLLMENDRVRVLETAIRQGDRTPIHTHRWPAALYVVSWSHFVRYDDRGNIIVDSRNVEALREPPPSLWSAALPPHSLENVGSGDLRIISVELKG